MNLKKLFDMQKKLDEKILERFPHLRNEDLLPKKILALQVELGELCNCWRGFKFWSNNQKPRTWEIKEWKDKNGESHIRIRNPLLEEYVDGLHFILSIGLETYTEEEYKAQTPINLSVYGELNGLTPRKYNEITKQFNRLYDNIGYLEDCLRSREYGTYLEVEEQYKFVFEMFLGLGEMLGLTEQQVEQAYLEKNRVNHQRQEDGY